MIENVDLLVSNLNTQPNELLISTVNELQVPILGRHWLYTIELIDQMFSLNNAILIDTLISKEVLKQIFNLYLEFPNNSFL